MDFFFFLGGARVQNPLPLAGAIDYGAPVSFAPPPPPPRIAL